MPANDARFVYVDGQAVAANGQEYELRELTPTEWFDFCAIIFEGTTDHLREQAENQVSGGNRQ
jgi:hypothetical protein